MTLTLASIALSLFAPTTPAASAPPAPVSVTASVGRGKTWDDESSIGSGTSAAAGVEWRFRPKWSVGAEIERLGHDRDTSFLKWSGRTIFTSANATYHFGARGVSPYAGGGFGGAFYKGTLMNHSGLPLVSGDRSSKSIMAYGTAGVEIPVGNRFALSPEVRIMMLRPPNDSAPWAAIRFDVKAVVRLANAFR